MMKTREECAELKKAIEVELERVHLDAEKRAELAHTFGFEARRQFEQGAAPRIIAEALRDVSLALDVAADAADKIAFDRWQKEEPCGSVGLPGACDLPAGHDGEHSRVVDLATWPVDG